VAGLTILGAILDEGEEGLMAVSARFCVHPPSASRMQDRKKASVIASFLLLIVS
jgi:hypothetical protein